MIRKKLEDYNAGKVNRQAFAQYTREKLREAVKQSQEIEGIIRFSGVNEKLLALGKEIDEKFYKELLPSNQIMLKGPVELEGKKYIIVRSPILNEKQEGVGKDLILFHISEIEEFISQIQSPVFIFAEHRILMQNPASKPLSKELIAEIEKKYLKNREQEECGEIFISYGKIESLGWVYAIGTYKEKFYQAIQHEIAAVLLITLALVLIGMIAAVFIVYPITGKIIMREDQLQEEIDKKTAEIEKETYLKNMFYRILAHDIKSPIASSISYLSLIIESLEQEKDPELFHGLRLVKKMNENIFHLMENILLWAESQNKTIQLFQENLNIKDLIKKETELFLPGIHQKKIDLRMNLDETLQLFADSDMLKTVVRNLISNAIKFTRKKGVILVSARSLEGKKVIEIQDNGVGISEEKIKSIFEYNPRKSTSGTEGEKGTGLGLILYRDFVEKNGGVIEIESAENQGTLIRLVFL